MILRNLRYNQRMMRKSKPLDALMPRIRQAILITTILQPERWWYQSDLAHHIGVTPSSLQRELVSLREAGILEARREGSRIYCRANAECPFLSDLQGLLIKTAGLFDVLREGLEGVLASVDFAFIYGSAARGEEVAASDVDLMLIGDVRMAEKVLPLRQLEKQIQRGVNPVLLSWAEFVQKRTQEQHFLMNVLRGKKIYLKGSDDELDTTYHRAKSKTAYDEFARTE